VRKVIYSMSMSLDGFIADPAGQIDWTGPDDELHRFHNDRTRGQGAQLLGRRLYETMLHWDNFEERNPAATETELDFARIWEPLPKIVFSRTLTAVQGAHTRLAQGTPAQEVQRLRAEPGEGDIGVGGAGLAAGLVAAGLVDEFHLFVAPIVLGAGTRFFPPLEHRIPLELAEQREFAGGVQHLRYLSVDAARRRGAVDALRR
jgi:dihydrofolate reductase